MMVKEMLEALKNVNEYVDIGVRSESEGQQDFDRDVRLQLEIHNGQMILVVIGGRL